MGKDEVYGTIIIAFFSFQSFGPSWLFCVFFYYCTHHSLVIVWDIFMKLYRNVYKVKTVSRLQECSPHIKFPCYASLNNFFHFSSIFCKPHNSVTV